MPADPNAIKMQGPDTSGNPLDVNIVSGGGGGAVTIANGADVAEGNTADAAVTTDANGTLSGKIRGLIVLFLSVISGGKVKVAKPNAPSSRILRSIAEKVAAQVSIRSYEAPVLEVE